MARTPLLRSLRALIRDVRASRRTGVPVDAVREARAAAPRGLSRRKFLTGAAAGAAALGLARPARALAATQKSVTIVGGGIAGLTCALTLRDHGFASTVYEASGRVGGRMFSNHSPYWAGGQVSEWCGELIDTGHVTMHDLATRYGLALDNLHAAEPAGATDTYFLHGHYYPYAQAVTDFNAIVTALDADANDAGFPTTYNVSTPAGVALDQMSVYQWIESRVPGGHGSPLGQLLDVAYTIEYGADTRVQSSLNLVYLLGFQPGTPPFAIFGQSDERFHIRGGNERLPEAIAADLGDQVRTGHELVRLARTPGGRYACTFERGATTCEVVSDFVVLALPFAVLDGIDTARAGFDARKRTAIHTLGRGHNGKINLQFEQRGWRGNGPWPGTSNGTTFSDTGYQASWEVSRAQPGTAGILVLYSGGDVTDDMFTSTAFATAKNPDVVRDVERGLSQLAHVYPHLAWNGRATQSLPHKSRFFGASYSYWKVGQYTQIAGYEGVTMGGVHFCGEHTSIDFQGFMEGGASTGKSTAETLATLL